MKDKGKQKRIRLAEEQVQNAERDAVLTQRLITWKRRTLWLAATLAVSVGSLVPFLAGHARHPYFSIAGKGLVLLSMCLVSAVMYAAGTTYNIWSYRRSMRQIYG